MSTGITNTLEIEKGINAVGIYTNDTIDITTIDTGDLTTAKTIANGTWKSWTKDTPSEYQGFTDMESGKGYVVIADNPITVDLPASLLDIDTITPSIGLNAIALPFTNKKLRTSYIGKMKVFNVRTYDDGWKSWTENTPEAYQGFIDIDYKKGYVVDVYDVNAANLDAGVDNIFNITEWGSDITDNSVFTIPGLDRIFNSVFTGMDIDRTYVIPYSNILNLTNILFKNTTITGVYDEDISLNYLGNPVMDNTAILDSIFNSNFVGINNIHDYVYNYITLMLDNDIVFLDNVDNGIYDEDMYPSYIGNPIMDNTAVLDNVFNASFTGYNNVHDYVYNYITLMLNNDIVILDNIDAGIKDDQELHPSYISNPIMDNTAVLDNVFNITTWGSDITEYPVYIKKLHVTPEFVGPNTISVMDQELLYDVSNFIDTFKI